jgi:hypothetical protein
MKLRQTVPSLIDILDFYWLNPKQIDEDRTNLNERSIGRVARTGDATNCPPR